MKVVVLTTSYPRGPDDVAGVFVRDAVEHLRAAGVDVTVVSPASFRHYGLAYGDGIVGNLRRRPWKALLLPAFLASYSRAARRAARDADLVHAHWLPSALPAVKTRKPFVLQLWGTDVELGRRARWAARRLVKRARLVLCPSQALVEDARALGARDVRVVPSGVEIPEAVGASAEPPHVLFVGRLSEEKGVDELLEATRDLPRVIVGDGPLRDRVPEAVGFVPPVALGRYYERAAVVVCPSRREGYGVVAREAMAHGRPVVATAVGGLVDAVEDGVTGLLVPPRDPAALRAAVERLLADEELRQRLGAAARDGGVRALLVGGRHGGDDPRVPRRTRPGVVDGTRVGWREGLLAACAGVVLAVLMSWPLTLHLGSEIGKDLGDPLLQAWQVAWIGHALLTSPLKPLAGQHLLAVRRHACVLRRADRIRPGGHARAGEPARCARRLQRTVRLRVRARVRGRVPARARARHGLGRSRRGRSGLRLRPLEAHAERPPPRPLERRHPAGAVPPDSRLPAREPVDGARGLAGRRRGR